jgi:hypothetical protein
MEPEVMADARQRLGEHFPMATDIHATIKEMLGAVFSMRSVSYLILNKQWKKKRRLFLPAWELAADTYLLKFQRLLNKFPCTIRNFPRCILVRNLHTALNLPYA